MKNLVIENGDFIFHTRREICEHMNNIKNTIEINNVKICHTENAALSVNGCFKVSFEKLTYSNITWRGQELFAFKEGILNTKNVLIKNILPDINMKHKKYEKKVLFLIDEAVAEIQNILIKNSMETSSVMPQNSSAVVTVQNC